MVVNKILKVSNFRLRGVRMQLYNYERIEELEGLIYDSMLEEIIFMEKEFFPCHYMLLSHLSEEDQHRIRLINTCETYKSDNENYNLLMNTSSNRETIETCRNIIEWQCELIGLYEDELKRIGLDGYEYQFSKK